MSLPASSRRHASSSLRLAAYISRRHASFRGPQGNEIVARSEDPVEKILRESKLADKQIEDGETPFKWEPTEYTPDVRHRGYDDDHIMDFRDAPARYPPALAARRYDKLQRARELGVRHNLLNKPLKRGRDPLPDVPVFLNIDPKSREKVKYQAGKVGITNERREFFADEAAMRADLEEPDGDWSTAEVGEQIPGYEMGRIVECRRSGQTVIGMILASLVISGRPRLLVLKSTGEIWPMAAADVQFVMPSSLIRPQTAQECWSPELLDLWAKGEEATGAEIADTLDSMQRARREVVMIIRKIIRETERMCGRIMSGMSSRGRAGGMEGIWEEITPENDDSRTSVTSAEIAERLLNTPGSEKTISVKPNTLPAYAAHVLMMRRPDMFLADLDVHQNGRFLVKSRAERQRMKAVIRLADKPSVDESQRFDAFIDKARKVIMEARRVREMDRPAEAYTLHEHDLPDWTAEERDIISMMMLRWYESRSTQHSPIDPFIVSVLRALDCYEKEGRDSNMVPQMMIDLGVQPPWESLKGSEIEELVTRSAAVEQTRIKAEGDLLQGNELDFLREDFTSQKVFVVDDPSASELDDGISIERIPESDSVWVHVHVADPTRYIPLNHPISAQASFRGSSFYAPEGNSPLFPLDVIMKELSLGAKTTRDDGAQGTMVFSTKLSATGDVLDSAVRMGWIKNPRVVTYQAVDKALGVAAGKVSKPFGTPTLQMESRPIGEVEASDMEDLRLLQQFANAYRLRRMATAGFEAYQPDTSLSLVTKIPTSITNLYDPTSIPSRPMLYSGLPILDWTVKHRPTEFTGLSSAMIIAEMMILAGRTAASWCQDRELPIPYRLSNPPAPAVLPGQSPISLDELLAGRDPQTMTSDSYALARASLSYTPGEMSLQPGQHWAMGFTDNAGYVRATSPLRRFEDMLVHWQIKAALAKEKGLDSSLAPSISKEEMETYVKRLEPVDKKFRKASKTARIWWEAGLFASRLNIPRPDGYVYGNDFVDITQPLFARVSGATVYGTTSAANTTPVFIPELGAEARLPGLGTSSIRAGDEIKIRVVAARQWPSVITDVELVD